MSTTTAVPFHTDRRRPQTQGASAARPAAGLRLTRRGRIVVFVLGLVVAFLIAFLVAGGSVATDSAEPLETVTVGSGDTLWAIADERTDGDVLEMIEHIKELNDLDGGSLQVGQSLRVPA